MCALLHRGGLSKRAYSAATPVACCVYILTHVSPRSSAVCKSRAAFGWSGLRTGARLNSFSRTTETETETVRLLKPMRDAEREGAGQEAGQVVHLVLVAPRPLEVGDVDQRRRAAGALQQLLVHRVRRLLPHRPATEPNGLFTRTRAQTAKTDLCLTM